MRTRPHLPLVTTPTFCDHAATPRLSLCVCRHNKLMVVPSSLCECVHLEEISLDSNSLHSLPVSDSVWEGGGGGGGGGRGGEGRGGLFVRTRQTFIREITPAGTLLRDVYVRS